MAERDQVVMKEKRTAETPRRDWRSLTLGEVMTLQRGFDLPKSKRLPGQHPVIASTGPVGTHHTAAVQGPGVVIGRSGSLGGGQFIKSDFWPLNTTLWVKDFKGNDRRFCFYLLKSLDLAQFNAGSGVPTLNRNHIHPLPVSIPSVTTQRKIAHVLGTLDDKIELNRRMNETLEEMARALFKSWFVDFDPVRAKMDGRWRRGESLPGLPADLYDLFPARLVDSELGEIPDGWEVRRIEDIAERVAMGPFGSSIKVSTFVDSGIPIISGQHLKETLLEDGDYRFITEDHAERLSNSNARRGDIVFTHAGTIGQVAYIPETSQYQRYVISQRQFYLRCDASQISPLFVVHFFKTTEGQHQLLANTSSTGVPSIARPVTHLRSIQLCVPAQALWRVFHDIVRGLHLAVGQNTAERHTLSTQRDALLPKLVSGEVRVSGIERTTEVTN